MSKRVKVGYAHLGGPGGGGRRRKLWANRRRRWRRAGRTPPPFPNGWFVVAETREVLDGFDDDGYGDVFIVGDSGRHDDDDNSYMLMIVMTMVIDDNDNQARS